MPYLIGGFRNWLIPLISRSPDITFPRLNNWSFWLLIPAIIFIILSSFIRRVRARWTIYPPLSSLEQPIDWAIFSLHVARISSILRSINIFTTIIIISPKRYSLYNTQLFLWCILVTIFILLTTLPVLAARITIILFDRHLSTSFFDVTRGRDPILFQHLFWFFRHPEVYVLILPRFRILSHILIFYSNIIKPFRYIGIVWSIISIRFLRFIVWAHHMYSIRIDSDSKSYFSAATIIIRVPTRVKIFSWIKTLSTDIIIWDISVILRIFFLFLFTARRLTRVVLSNACVDLNLHDTYYVVAHFHYVLSMRAVFSILIGTYHWIPLFSRIRYNKLLSKVFSLLIFIRVNIIFIPIHTLRIARIPR
jgi:cytochrome c oxidase subunit 1